MFGGPSGRLPMVRSDNGFNSVPRASIQRSAFDRSSKHMTTINASTLYPIFVDEVLPGDTFSLQSTIFARLTTSLVPAMDNLTLDTQYFFVPNRLVWTHWEKFCGSQDNPGDSISYSIPQMNGPFTVAAMSIGDYFGLPVNTSLNPGVSGTAGYCSALPFRAYNLIWNDWYRDENLQNSLTIDTSDGPDMTSYALQSRGKGKDYFYGSLPFVQKGTAVGFLNGHARIIGDGTNAISIPQFKGLTSASVGPIQTKGSGTLPAIGVGNSGWSNGEYLAAAPLDQGMYADLSTDATDLINTLRQAFQIQKFMERDARGGTRYTELILSHFGVTNPDFRLQRPEYLGGGSTQITTTPIPQTTPSGISGTTTKFGDLAAFSTALGRNHGFTHSFTEHGHIIGLASVRATLTYQQGLNKMWTRQTRYDYYWPVFAHLGEQAVLGSEIYYLGDKAGSNTDASVWGYQERYAEYRYKPSQISGMFRSYSGTPLDQWHYAQNYASRPSLNSTYLPDDTFLNLDRNLAVSHSTAPQIKLDIYHKLKCARPMPVYGVPGDIDRF